MKTVLFVIFCDISLKVMAWNLPTEQFTLGIYPCYNTKPITLITFIYFLPMALLIFFSKERLMSILVAWGAFSNTIERLLWGKVIDMIIIPVELIFEGLKTPIINIADILIFMSVYLAFRFLQRIN